MKSLWRYLITLLIVFFLTTSQAQSFISYKDTLNRFTIDIPVGWKYGLPKNYPSIKLIAYRTPDSPADTSKDNFNLNILQTPNLTLNDTYSKFLESIKDAENFTLIQSGDTIVNGKKFRWLIETHRNNSDNIQIHNYDFVTYQNDKTYILTLVTFSNRFEIIKPLFDRIVNSFFLNE